MRSIGVWTIVLGVGGLLAARSVKAQPQDDAALAHEPLEDSKARVAPEPVVDDGPPLTTEQLRQQYPDLEVQAVPHVRLGIFFGALAPFQLLGFGLSSDVYAVPWFRLSGFATGGISPTLNRQNIFNAYAEASLGLVVARWLGETTVRVPAPTPRFALSRSAEAEPAPLQRVLVPRSHSLELEVGALSGYYALYRCTANCIEADVLARTMQSQGSQLAIPFAGVRYVYHRWARSLSRPFRTTQRFQATADLLTKPLNNPAADLQNVRGKTIEQSPVGGRLALQLPGFQREPNSVYVSMNLTLGYLPSPSDLILHASLAMF